jgi:DNA recombination protein RmuC
MIENLFFITAAVLILLAALAALAGLGAVAVRALRRNNAESAEAAEQRIAELARLQVETSARLGEMRDMLASRQAELARVVNDQQVELARVVNERLDSVTNRLSQSMTATQQHTTDNLAKLNERLVAIDGAQKNITELASQVTSLHSVLANKQSRGAFGQGRMEVIIQDGLPKGCYAFQHTLSNRTRPDCAIFMPDERPLVVDAKFPLEAVNAYREATTDEARKHAAARLRADIGKHVSDIAQKYLIPGETQEMALMFVPSESVYAELYDGFDDIVQKAYRARVVIVSPSLLMLAINVVQQIQKDARMREAADKIHAEVGHLMDDIRRLHERVMRLQTHFGQANEDVRQILISAEKLEKRGTRIREVEFEDDASEAGNIVAAGKTATVTGNVAGNVIPVPTQRKLQLGE